jgi:hypothetical protein
MDIALLRVGGEDADTIDYIEQLVDRVDMGRVRAPTWKKTASAESSPSLIGSTRFC